MAEQEIADEMMPLPRDGSITPGTLVWGSDFNSAMAQLYRWWGLLDAPAATDTAPFWDDLFDIAAEVATPEVTAERLEALQLAVAKARATARWSHHMGYDDFRLVWRAPELFEVMATVTLQRADTGNNAVEYRCAMTALLRKRGDGRLVFQRIAGTAHEPPRAAAFAPSYIVNRARATSVRFQAHMDGLSGRTNGMRDLLMPQLELHGLVASKKDATAGDQTLTDVNDLRKSIAGSDTVADNVIRDFAGFTAWFATCTDLFTYGLHKLEDFSVKPLADSRFEVVAKYDWRAETLNGAKIETHQPLTWVFVDTGEAWMRIETLLPFG